MHRGAFQILFSYFHGIFLKPKFSFIPIWLFFPSLFPKKKVFLQKRILRLWDPQLAPWLCEGPTYVQLVILDSGAMRIGNLKFNFDKRISVSMFQWSCGQVFVDLAMFGGGDILGVYNRGVLVTTSPKHSLKSALSPTPPRGPAGCFRP